MDTSLWWARIGAAHGRQGVRAPPKRKHCAAASRPGLLSVETVREVLDQVEFVDISRKDLIDAASLAPLRSNDALHISVALRLEVNEFITYDRELIDAAERFGVRAVSPAGSG